MINDLVLGSKVRLFVPVVFNLKLRLSQGVQCFMRQKVVEWTKCGVLHYSKLTVFLRATLALICATS